MLKRLNQMLFTGQLTPKARVLAAIAGVAMLGAIVLPLWQMTMISNQYPEGLRMWIYSYKITGDLQEINTLNHYIGMRALDDSAFTELRVLPYSFAIGGALCLVAAALRRRWFTSLVLFGGIASGLGSMLILFYELYTYGHNLNPKAAIDVPPFTPAPIGVSQLANFHVTTFFHAGSILFIGAVLALVIALWISRRGADRRTLPVADTQLPAGG